jgi:hypothetical protein
MIIVAALSRPTALLHRQKQNQKQTQQGKKQISALTRAA